MGSDNCVATPPFTSRFLSASPCFPNCYHGRSLLLSAGNTLKSSNRRLSDWRRSSCCQPSKLCPRNMARGRCGSLAFHCATVAGPLGTATNNSAPNAAKNLTAPSFSTVPSSDARLATLRFATRLLFSARPAATNCRRRPATTIPTPPTEDANRHHGTITTITYA
ncbi:MAG: hypothetical protein UZ07_CHB004000894 [Chlorobi bacterium OLB7]|nr:MAG: hypothetical protein UZ07_CHB004000894 [Chlorobi bacterium OLB7]